VYPARGWSAFDWEAILLLLSLLLLLRNVGRPYVSMFYRCIFSLPDSNLKGGRSASCQRCISGRVFGVVHKIDSEILFTPLLILQKAKRFKIWLWLRFPTQYTWNALASDRRNISYTLGGWNYPKKYNIYFSKMSANVNDPSRNNISISLLKA